MVSEERPLVASVIYNRLNMEMPLQMCSTVQYILGEPKAVLTYADTEIDSPYNTYQNPGLPPGPICNPGYDALLAAVQPSVHDYYYYVANADHTAHIYAKTQEEQTANIAAVQREKDAAGD